MENLKVTQTGKSYWNNNGAYSEGVKTGKGVSIKKGVQGTPINRQALN